MKRPRHIRAALIGERLGINFLPQIHGQLADYPFERIELARKDLPLFLERTDFNALNLCAPYRQDVIPCLDRISAQAERIGAVDTVIRNLDGTLCGFNTEYTAFCDLSDALGVSFVKKKVLVLGEGDTANAVAAAAADRGASKVVLLSPQKRNYTQRLAHHTNAEILINATRIGAYPENDKAPVSLSELPGLIAVFDLIFDPARTRLLREARSRGIPHCNGLLMLVAMARRSAEIFLGSPLPDSEVTRITKAIGERLQSILFIGMPGCGATTLGRMIATRSARDFIDLDTEIEKRVGCAIPEFCAKQGEQALRAIEHELLAHYTKESELVITAGSDAITNAESIPLMQQNARVVFLDISPDLLPQSLHALYRERRPLYLAAADFTVPITRDFDENVIRIKEALN